MPTFAQNIEFWTGVSREAKPKKHINTRRTVSMQANYAAQSMEIIADNSTASPAPQRQYNIDREELLRLREDKLIQDKTFVYIAIKLSYDCSDSTLR